MPDKIPLKIRTAYVAYIRVTMALEVLYNLPRNAPRPPHADKTLDNLRMWQDGLHDKLKPFLESLEGNEQP